jgi:uncharacterized cofD-like protein
VSVRPARPTVVAVGGGHGCARSLAALRRLDVDRTAVVTVADDGGSSGRIRRDHGVVALGDLRMALLTLAEAADDPAATGADGSASARSTAVELARLAGRRFARGELAGHSLGNLLLLGLLEEHDGELMAALAAFGRLTGAVGRVLPATTSAVTLSARTAEGTVTGQTAVATTRRILDVRLEPEAPAPAPGVLDSLTGADLVLIGPGSLYTSVLPVLLVDGVADALARTAGRVVLVGNLREQPGETEGMDLADHVDALRQHLPGLRLDVVAAHRPPADAPQRRRAALEVDEARLRAAGATLLAADLGDESDGHDPARLAALLAGLLGGSVGSPSATPR